jgi:hypothetical protein
MTGRVLCRGGKYTAPPWEEDMMGQEDPLIKCQKLVGKVWEELKRENITLHERMASFLIKGQIVNILGVVIYISVVIMKLHCHSIREAIDNVK